ncbi:MAG: site-2 protease family protein [Gemmatimonadota bacterium]
MARGFSLGRMMGFPISADYSWLILFFLILWSFTAGVFPAAAPGLSSVAYLAMGLGGTVLFFVSLIIHELAHAVVARVKGIEVDGITLFVFGGLARTRSESTTPGDEFQIAGVGPLASFGLAALFWLIGWAAAAADASPAVAVVATYLAALNLALAVFNLLPGFPLDGGRLLRAAVWKVTGDMTRATRVAARAGQGLGWLLIGFGVLLAVGGQIVSGLWLMFIGWFLGNAARSSVRQHLARSALDGASAARLMRPVAAGFHGADDEVRVAASLPMTEVIEELRAAPTGRVLVVEGDTVVGVVNAADVAAWMGGIRYRNQEGR